MVWLGRILGAVLAIGVFFTEVVFANDQSWPDAVPFALAVAGIIVGSALGRRLANRNAEHAYASREDEAADTHRDDDAPDGGSSPRGPSGEFARAWAIAELDVELKRL